MKFKLLFLLLIVTSSVTCKADHFGPSILHYAQIKSSDVAPNKVKSSIEIKEDDLKKSKVIFKINFDTCPPPKWLDYKSLCVDIGSRAKSGPIEGEFYYEYQYETRLLQLACVNIGADSEVIIKSKVQLYWNKYIKNCKCETSTWIIPGGNILKFALHQSQPEVIETFVSTYGLDINFIDSFDGLNLYDFIISEIERFRKLPNGAVSAKIWEQHRLTVKDLGGKSNK